MAKKLTQMFSTLFFITSILVNFLGLTMQDEPCPYPCYPPPTGPGSGTPTTGTPPPPATTLTPPNSGSGSSYPPPYYLTPSGNLPNYPSPPYGNNIYGPPPPDPILPYFPYYYRKPPHETDDQSSARTLGKSTVLVTAANALVFLFLVTSCLS